MHESGAQGVGLFRTEFLFMNRKDLPSEDEQFEAYREVAQAMDGRPVVIRTLDLGADKALAGNGGTPTCPIPALGLRAIRYCLAEPQMFLAQLRAILRASQLRQGAGSCCRCSRTRTRSSSRSRIVRAGEAAARGQAHRPYDKAIEVGGMIEMPAAALALPMFMSGSTSSRSAPTT